MQKLLVSLYFIFSFSIWALAADQKAIPEYPVAVSNQSESSGSDSFKVGDQLRFTVQGPDLGTGDINVDQKELNEKGWQFLISEISEGNLSFLVVPIKPGDIILPSFEVKSKDGTVIAKTQSIKTKITSVIPAEDNKPAEEVPWRPPEKVSFPWLMAVAIAIVSIALLAVIFYWIFKKLSKKKAVVQVEKQHPPIPEDEAALNALEALEQSGLLQSGKYKSFYFKASEIMKTFIGARYSFDAQESTTNEILRHLERKEKLQGELVDQLDSLFQRMDRVKFTDYVPDYEHGRALIQDAKMFVLRVKKPKIVTGQKESVRNAV